MRMILNFPMKLSLVKFRVGSNLFSFKSSKLGIIQRLTVSKFLEHRKIGLKNPNCIRKCKERCRMTLNPNLYFIIRFVNDTEIIQNRNEHFQRVEY